MAHGAARMRAAADLHHVGVAEDDVHALDRHMKQVGYDLRKTRLVALAARLRADDDVHASLRPHGDARLLVGRADRGFDVVREPAAEKLAAFGSRADRKSTRLNSSHLGISYAVFCLKNK